MTNDAPLDILQVKIDKAMQALPRATRKAIEAVDWRAVILGMREKKGYNFEQLEDLELETELALCGLGKPEDYPQRLEESLEIPRSQVDLLVSEMNEFVFKKIREELIKNSDREAIFVKKGESVGKTIPIEEIKPQNSVSVDAPIQPENKVATPADNIPKIIAENIELKKPELGAPEVRIPEPASSLPIEDIDKKTIATAIADKLSGQYKTPVKKTEYSLDNLSKDVPSSSAPSLGSMTAGIKSDPYRIDPNE